MCIYSTDHRCECLTECLSKKYSKEYRNYQTGNERVVETETRVDVAGTALVVIVAVVVGVFGVGVLLLVVRGRDLEAETGIVGPGHHPVHLARDPRRRIGRPLQPLRTRHAIAHTLATSTLNYHPSHYTHGADTSVNQGSYAASYAQAPIYLLLPYAHNSPVAVAVAVAVVVQSVVVAVRSGILGGPWSSPAAPAAQPLVSQPRPASPRSRPP